MNVTNASTWLRLMVTVAAVLIASSSASPDAGQDLLECGYCGKKIVGKYFVVDDVAYHENCYLNHLAPRCDFGGEVLDGPYQQDVWGVKVCSAHVARVPLCSGCNGFLCGPMLDQATFYDDGRRMCPRCRATAVDSLNEARALLAEVALSLQSYGIAVDSETPLELVNLPELRRQSGGLVADPHGLAEDRWVKRLGKVTHHFTIYALHGMPRASLRATLAHELMHTWLYLNADSAMAPILIEGSCNYAALLALQTDTSEAADREIDRLVDDSDPLYGEGFRAVKAFVEEVGLEAWLEYLKHNNEPPWR